MRMMLPLEWLNNKGCSQFSVSQTSPLAKRIKRIITPHPKGNKIGGEI